MTNEETTTEVVFQFFTFNEVIALIVGALRGRADFYDEEIKAEDLKGAGDRGKVASLHWGAKEMRDIADVVSRMPEGEPREVSLSVPAFISDIDNFDDEPEEAAHGVLAGITDDDNPQYLPHPPVDLGTMTVEQLREAFPGVTFTDFASYEGEQTEDEAVDAAFEAPDDEPEDEEADNFGTEFEEESLTEEEPQSRQAAIWAARLAPEDDPE